MKHFLAVGVLWLAALLAGASPIGFAQGFDNDDEQASEFNFVATDTFDFAEIMPAPPAPGSLAHQADIEAVLQVQAWRTPKQVAWAKRIKAGDLFDYADVLGKWFTEENLPLTAALLERVDADLTDGIYASKRYFARPRPYIADTRVQPCVRRLGTESYPSGHTLSFYVEAGVLAEIFPDKRAALFEFAQKMAWGRVIAGVHYPTDLVAGRVFAEAIMEELKKSPAFQAALGTSRAEILAMMKSKTNHSWSE
jgi:acid phosphatase (class A)